MDFPVELIWFLVLAIVGGIIVHLFDESRIKKQEEFEQDTLDMAHHLGKTVFQELSNHIERGRLPIVQKQEALSLNLKIGEYPIVSLPAGLYGETISGQYSGLSLPIGYGAYYDVGQTNITSSLQMIDNGELILTTQRLVFIGQTHNTSVELVSILGFQHYSDALVVNRSDQVKADIFFTGAGKAYALVVNLLLKHEVIKENGNTLILSPKTQ